MWALCALVFVFCCYFRRPLGVCFARVRKLPEIVARLRGRFEAQSSDELEGLSGGEHHRNGDTHYDEENMESPAAVVLLRTPTAS